MASTAGAVEWRGAPNLGFVFQEPTLAPWSDVFDNVWLPLRLKGISRNDAMSRVRGALGNVGLAGFEERQIGTLSGGQMQRMLFARLALQDAPLVLLDEPFAAVDETATHDLMHIVEAWHAEGRTVLAVLHDLDLVRRQFPKTLLIAREPVAFGPTSEALSEANLARARRMVEAFDRAAHECERAA